MALHYRTIGGSAVLAFSLACAGTQPPPPVQSPPPAGAPVPVQTVAPKPGGQPVIDAAAPKWLKDLIVELTKEPARNPPATISEFQYRGQTVYYLPPAAGDQMSVLFDAKGKAICSPDGGFTGRGDGKCNDFFDTRRNEKTIWRDTRR